MWLSKLNLFGQSENNFFQDVHYFWDRKSKKRDGFMKPSKNLLNVIYTYIYIYIIYIYI